MVKSLGEGDQTLLQLGRKPSHACPEASQGRATFPGLVKSLGKRHEALLEVGREFYQARSDIVEDPVAVVVVLKPLD
ncbi:hypothetical protein [Mesorhizobium sp. M0496]|uniref:hypothetical protein n=1 Tax=Mesorhizobium sp. M0496 TaxID=2956952 RepID=UPI0033394429